jgi:hypothetical protein
MPADTAASGVYGSGIPHGSDSDYGFDRVADLLNSERHLSSTYMYVVAA